jgi:hypothetical protein
MNNIIFGSKRIGVLDNAPVKSHAKYDVAVVTIEAAKGARKSRRLLFNAAASKAMHLDSGEAQRIAFAWVNADELGEKKVYITNAEELSNVDNINTYKTSKNPVVFSENTKEKCKAISSSTTCAELNEFLGLDDTVDQEFFLVLNQMEGITTDTYILSTERPAEEVGNPTLVEEVENIEVDTATNGGGDVDKSDIDSVGSVFPSNEDNTEAPLVPMPDGMI